AARAHGGHLRGARRARDGHRGDDGGASDLGWGLPEEEEAPHVLRGRRGGHRHKHSARYRARGLHPDRAVPAEREGAVLHVGRRVKTRSIVAALPALAMIACVRVAAAQTPAPQEPPAPPAAKPTADVPPAPGLELAIKLGSGFAAGSAESGTPMSDLWKVPL